MKGLNKNLLINQWNQFMQFNGCKCQICIKFSGVKLLVIKMILALLWQCSKEYMVHFRHILCYLASPFIPVAPKTYPDQFSDFFFLSTLKERCQSDPNPQLSFKCLMISYLIPKLFSEVSSFQTTLVYVMFHFFAKDLQYF